MIEWYLMKYFNIFILREWLTNIFGTHYPKEIVMVIMTIIPRKIRISCGAFHNNIVHNDKIYMWGCNEYGQLGLGRDCKNKKTPTKITLHKNIKSIVCGGKFTIAVVSNSKELYYWGRGNLEDEIYSPTKLILNVDSNIKSINCGHYHRIILLQSGKCYSWGNNSSGQLGLGHYTAMSSPQEITSLGMDIIIIECGSNSVHSIAVSKSGKCYTWGLNNHGQLGLGDFMNRCSPSELPLQNIISIGCGGWHNIVITIDMKIYVWGNNAYGQLGLGHNICQNKPQEFSFRDIKIESVSCGFFYTMGLTTSGKLYVWGRNDYGQLGLNDIIDRNFPKEVYLKESIKSIHCGFAHSICTTHNSKIYSWGNNQLKQLGDTEDRSKPCELKFFS